MNSYREPGLFDLRGIKLHLGRRELIGTLSVVAISSFAAFAAKPVFGEISGALIFVLGIILAGALCGLAASLIAALAAFLLHNFYFADPVLTFRIATGSDIAPLVVFNLCAVVAGVLAGRLNDRAQAANRSNLHLASLLEASEILQSAVRLQDIAAALTETAPGRSGMQPRLFRVRDDALVPLDASPADAMWMKAAETCRAGTRPSCREGALVAYRLDASEGIVGVMVVDQSGPEEFEPAFMAALANLIALALERATFSERIAENRAAARTEELKTALLSSVSHDFRTPLTTISASASSLIDYREQLDRETSLRLLRGIVEECDRLNRYTANLLEMSRLEAGQPPGQLQMLGVSEMLSTVVQRVRPRAEGHHISRVLTGDDLLVCADAALFELVLVNVLDNAIAYSASGTRILIESDEDGGFCRITIADEGQGIPPDELDRVFDRFYRVSRAEPSPRGSGLGLAIAKGFVEALGGRIEAQSPGIGEKGTRIVIHLPLAQEETLS
jgi:two-component system sensor histidine kinase KdpD